MSNIEFKNHQIYDEEDILSIQDLESLKNSLKKSKDLIEKIAIKVCRNKKQKAIVENSLYEEKNLNKNLVGDFKKIASELANVANLLNNLEQD